MAFSGGDGGRGPMSEINVTPLVDVMLVLLIIFMVAAPMLTTGVDVDLPAAEAPRMEVDEDIPLIIVDAEHNIYFFEEQVTLEQLRRKLETDERVRERQEVYVHADTTVPYGEVVQVLAIVRQVGIQKMGLVTEPALEDE